MPAAWQSTRSEATLRTVLAEAVDAFTAAATAKGVKSDAGDR